MKLITPFALVAMLAMGEGLSTRKHNFITLDNLEPNQLGNLMNGDWKSMLPDNIKRLMKTDE